MFNPVSAEFPGISCSHKLATVRGPAETAYSASVMDLWDLAPLPLISEKQWVPKNPEVKLKVSEDIPLSDDQWEQLNFPYHPIPPTITTHVNCSLWEARLAEMDSDPQMVGQAGIMRTVLNDLTCGCNSGVGPPGDQPSVSPNLFQNPAIDLPRIIDAITTEVKQQHMSGPFKIGSVKSAKVNGFISVVKDSGARRQVGNLSAPAGLSFNDGISKNTLKEWKVVQTIPARSPT